MDVTTTAPYVFTCNTALPFWLTPYWRKQPFESKDTRESFRHDYPSHNSLYLGLSLMDSGINGYDFPKERKYYVAATVNREALKKTAPVMSADPSWDETFYL
jgi:hypothetical protein